MKTEREILFEVEALLEDDLISQDDLKAKIVARILAERSDALEAAATRYDEYADCRPRWGHESILFRELARESRAMKPQP